MVTLEPGSIDPGPGSTSDPPWPDDDADSIPTQPHSQPPPERATVIDTLAEPSVPTVDLPPASFRDERDTVPAPPPGTPEDES